MPFISLKTSLIMVHKFSCNLGIAKCITVSMVIANNWLLAVEGEEHQNIKCRDTKSNDLIFGFYKSVIIIAMLAPFVPTKFHLKCCLLS